MHSPGHTANILRRGFRKFGIGAAKGTYNRSRVTMWTVDFGDR